MCRFHLIRVVLLRLVQFSLLLALATQCTAIHFYIRPGEKRCFNEELPVDTKITGELRVATGNGQMEIDFWIMTLNGKVLYHKRDPSHGKFSFSTPKHEPRGRGRKHDDYDDDDDEEDDEDYYNDEEDTYRICIEHTKGANGRDRGIHQLGDKRLIYYHVDHAYDHLRTDELHAKTEHTDRLQLRLKAMHDSLANMVTDLNKLQRRERILLERNGKTSRRLMRLATLSLFVIFGVSALQFWYYRRFFKAKKLC